MKELFVLIAHLLTTLIKLARPGGVRAAAAESMALKLQLVVVHRTRKRAPPMTPWDRLVFGLCALWIAPSRWKKVSVVFRPSTFQRFHDTLVRCKYRLLFGAKGRRKPGPKGPEKELIEAVVAMKRQNPRFGCLKIAQEITHAFGVEVNKGKVLVNGADAGLNQIQSGLAWHYKRYEREQSPEDRVAYARAEEKARAERRGLWRDPRPVPPWEFRRH